MFLYLYNAKTGVEIPLNDHLKKYIKIYATNSKWDFVDPAKKGNEFETVPIEVRHCTE